MQYVIFLARSFIYQYNIFLQMTTVLDICTARFFNITEKADRNILRAHQKAIILVGLTKAGKSTVFNWIQKKPIIGKGKLNSFYLPIAQSTMAPNICIDFQPNLSLFDMAGYQDTRNYAGVIGESYFLQALFEKVRKVKFVIVFDEKNFYQYTCKSLIKTFQGFINMFKFTLMPPQIKEKLKQSMSIVITKSQSSQHHFDYITQILESMAAHQFVFENKPLIMQLLEYLRDSSRLEAFDKARNGQQPKQCNFIEKFNALGWKFFDLDENQKLVGQSLISLPFKKDFQKLPEQDKHKLAQQLYNKVKNYMSYTDILSRLIENFIGNWESFIYDWKTKKIFNLSSFQLKSMFEQVRQFINMNDVYDFDQAVSIELKHKYLPPTLIESINSIFVLQKIMQAAGSMQYFKVRTVIDTETGEERQEEEMISPTFQDKMERFRSCFAEMIKIIKTFATSQDQQLLLEKTNFILQRGLREFEKIYELDHELLNDINLRLADSCNIPWSVDLREKIVTSLDEILLAKIFPSLQSLNNYVSFFNTYAEDRIAIAKSQSNYEEDRCFIFFSQHRNSIQTVKADLLLAQLQREKACLCYFDGLKNINKLQKCIFESQLYEGQTKYFELEKISITKLKLINKIVNLLKVFEGENNKFKIYALHLAKHHKMVDDTCKLYQLLIEGALDVDKYTLYQEYSDFCLEWDMIDKAKELLLKKLALQENSQKFGRVSIENCQKFGRISIEETTLDKMIKNINEQVQVVVRVLEMKKDLVKQ